MRAKQLLLILAILIVSPVFAQEGTSKKEKKQAELEETFQLINSGKFNFEANKAFPQGGQSVDLTTNPNFLRFNDTIVNADLPFFGEAYRVDYGSTEGGIEFEGPMEEYKVEKLDDKLQIELEFEVDDIKDDYKCYMTISYDRYTTLIINSTNRSQITYYGRVNKPEEE